MALPTLGNALIEILDQINPLLGPTGLDLTPNQATVHCVVYSGGKVGADGAVHEAAGYPLVLPQQYPIRQLTTREISNSGGLYEQGDIIIENLPPAYSDTTTGRSGGYTILQLSPRATSDGTDVYYEITGTHAGFYKIVEILTDQKIVWSIVLTRTATKPMVTTVTNLSVPLVTYDFTTAALGTWTNATFLATYGLSFVRASVATVQTSASAIDSTATADQPRIGSTGALWGRGLVIEESRTNGLLYSRDATNGVAWLGGGSEVSTANVGNGPDQTVHATRHQVPSNGYSRAQIVSLPQGTVTVVSEWIRASGTSSPYQALIPPSTWLPGTVTAAWIRIATAPVTVGVSAQESLYPVEAEGNGGVGACDVWTDFHQLETGAFPTEAIVTAGATVTRAGERLYLSSATPVVDASRLGLALTFVAKGTPTQYVSNAFLWFVDANNSAWMDTAQKINVKLGGVTVTSAAPIAWVAGDVVDVWISCGGGSNALVEYRRNSGTVTTLINGALAGNVSSSGTIDFMCSGATNQFTCWLQKLQAWPTGQAPAWVV